MRSIRRHNFGVVAMLLDQQNGRTPDITLGNHGLSSLPALLPA
jgi:hypothetical protein